ncbi:unnamed protein product, partial [Brassica rapa subsp. narinosa]
QNRAASIGGHALDVCSEFMPSPTFTSSDPTSLRTSEGGSRRSLNINQPSNRQEDSEDVIEALCRFRDSKSKTSRIDTNDKIHGRLRNQKLKNIMIPRN